jgi:ribose-phosphate pyrophosphokinase
VPAANQTRASNDKLCRLLFFIGALKDEGAARVTAVVPYLRYSRKAVTMRYVANMFESVDTDCVVTLDVHNPIAFKNAFSLPNYCADGDAGVRRLRENAGRR